MNEREKNYDQYITNPENHRSTAELTEPSKISFTDVVELQCEYCADVNDRVIPVQDHCTCDTPEIRDTEYMFQPEFENAED